MRIGEKVGAVLLVSIMACESPSEGTGGGRSPSTGPSRSSSSGGARKFLTYRIGIPRDSVLRETPEPYDPAKHGAYAKASPSLNVVPTPEWDGGPRARRANFPSLPVVASGEKRTSSPTPPLVGAGSDGNHIIWLRQGRGLNALVEAGPWFMVPWGSIWNPVAYAPTNLAPGGSCVEVSTIHTPANTFGFTRHGLGIWDFCQGPGTSFQWLNWYAESATETDSWWTGAFSNDFIRYTWDPWTGDMQYRYAVQVYADNVNGVATSPDTGTFYFTIIHREYGRNCTKAMASPVTWRSMAARAGLSGSHTI